MKALLFAVLVIAVQQVAAEMEKFTTQWECEVIANPELKKDCIAKTSRSEWYLLEDSLVAPGHGKPAAGATAAPVGVPSKEESLASIAASTKAIAMILGAHLVLGIATMIVLASNL